MTSEDNIGILDPNGNNMNPLTGEPYSDNYLELAKIWSKFPAYKNAKEIISDIVDNQVLLVISGTGSGKTVLVPKFLLHSYNYNAKIAITLPKQMIAKSAGEFAAKTLDVKIGDQVGYQYKGSDRDAVSNKVKLLYATDGTIVARLLKDPSLQDFNAVIIDEAHERKIQIDFLLYLLRNTLKIRPDFKLIIMSATVDDKMFASYFYEFKFKTINVGSATNYPIESIFLEKPIEDNYIQTGLEIIKRLQNTSTVGDILFFVTSINETQNACDIIRSDPNQGFCVEVFAGIDQKQQDLAQDKDKYKTVSDKNRKVVIATNVAESSLTIEGIKYVVDSGYEISSYYDPILRAKILERKLISQAQVIQRKGRAGRTEPGICYHLYTKNEFDNRMPKYPEPSIKTSNIYEDCLKFLHLNNVRTTENLLNILSNFIEPPKEIYIRSAITQLMQLGLILKDNITDLGDLVANLQLDPMQGVSIALGYKLRCAKEIAAIFSVMDTCKGSIGELFHKPSQLKNINSDALKRINDKYIEAKKKLFHKYGDHLTILKIFTLYTEYLTKGNDKSLDDWCYKHFLKKSILDKSNKNYKKIKNHIRMVMSSIDLNKIFSTETQNLQNLKLEYRIMVCIAFGFRLNITNLNSTKFKINRDSFMNFIDGSKLKGNIVYNELSSNVGKMEFNIVSNISNNIYKIVQDII